MRVLPSLHPGGGSPKPEREKESAAADAAPLAVTFMAFDGVSVVEGKICRYEKGLVYKTIMVVGRACNLFQRIYNSL